MPTLKWSQDELTVLIALYHRYGRDALDDRKASCQSFATVIGRSVGAVDHQMRNLDAHLRNKTNQHSGSAVRALGTKYGPNDLRELYKDANAIIDKNGWPIAKF